MPKPIPLEVAKRTKVFYHHKFRSSKGTAIAWKANGRIKTWKTRPMEYRLPIRHGLYLHSYLFHTSTGLLPYDPTCIESIADYFGFKPDTPRYVIADKLQELEEHEALEFLNKIA